MEGSDWAAAVGSGLAVEDWAVVVAKEKEEEAKEMGEWAVLGWEVGVVDSAAAAGEVEGGQAGSGLEVGAMASSNRLEQTMAG